MVFANRALDGIEHAANIHDIDLPPTLVGTVNGNPRAVITGTWMGITPPFTPIGSRRRKVAKIKASTTWHVIQKNGLPGTLSVGIRIVENPIAIGCRQVGIVTIFWHFLMSHRNDLAGSIFERVKP